MFKLKATATIAAAALAVIGLTGCVPETVDGRAVPTSRTQQSVDAGIGEWTFPTSTIPVAPADPYSSDGMWRVPQDIDPGDYLVTTDHEFGGYYKVCRTITCEIGTDGFIANDLFQGQTYVSIPLDAAYIELNDASLTPVG